MKSYENQVKSYENHLKSYEVIFKKKSATHSESYQCPHSINSGVPRNSGKTGRWTNSSGPGNQRISWNPGNWNIQKKRDIRKNSKKRDIGKILWKSEFPVERSNFWSNEQNSRKRDIREMRSHLEKSYKNNTESCKTV